jgi:putative SOS response-associated peptidase YedK
MVVVADGFYEWTRPATGERRPYYFRRDDGEPMALAGLWEKPVETDANDERAWLPTCTIVTTRANADVAGVHDRMPVVLDGPALDIWLDTSEYDRDELETALEATPPGSISSYPVTTALNRVSNDTPELIAPLVTPLIAQ